MISPVPVPVPVPAPAPIRFSRKVAPDALDDVLLHVAGAALDLDALVGDLHGDPRGVQLGHRDLAHGVLAVGVAPGGRVLLGLADVACRRHERKLPRGYFAPSNPADSRDARTRVRWRRLDELAWTGT
jgi:hypothetical protein